MNIEKSIVEATIAEIQAINGEDPNVESAAGEEFPKELLYTNRMLEVLAQFAPHADDDLKVACAGQHIARWEYPRNTYPEGRVGYLQWRKELYGIHADLTAKAALKAGASEEFATSVKEIMENKVSGNEGSQTLEDVACLVFLQHHFSEFATKHDEEKLIKIVQKTWGKMSDAAHEAALKLSFSESDMALLQKALA